MNPDELKKQIQNDFSNHNFLKNIENGNKHIEDKHINLSDKELLERLIGEHLIASTFKDKEQYEKIIFELINKNIDYIVEKLKTIKNEERFKITENTDEEMICLLQDIQGQIQKYITKKVSIILIKSKKTKYGFNLVTAYPRIVGENQTPIESDFRDIIKETKDYKEGSLIKRLYYEIAVMKDKPLWLTKINVNKLKKSKNILLKFKDPDIEHHLYQITISEKGTIWLHLNTVILHSLDKLDSIYSIVLPEELVSIAIKHPEVYSFVNEIKIRKEEIIEELKNEYKKEKVNELTNLIDEKCMKEK